MNNKRKNDPEGLKQRILESALTVFAEFGLQGGRMEQIAALAQTTKRMVVYHFTNKEALYIAVLEDAYRQIRLHELQLDLSALPPREAIEALAIASFDFHCRHPDVIRLICSENLLRGVWISQSATITDVNRSALTLLNHILDEGYRTQVFQIQASAIDVHRLISSICFHHVANNYTFNTLFNQGKPPQEATRQSRELVVTATLRYLGCE